MTKVAIGVKIRGHLRDELEQRKDTIQAELKTQEELLKVLSCMITHDLNVPQSRPRLPRIHSDQKTA